jgi:hypothetical protein
VTALAVRLADADADWHAASTAHLQAMAGRQIDEQALNNAHETAVATRLFHGLDPASCPRCETPVDSDRRAQEAAEHRCAVCAAPLTEDDNDAAADLIAEREQTLAASRAAEDDARRALEATEDEMSRLTRDLEAADTDLREAHAAREVGERATLETAIARAEGALAVLEIRDDQPPESDQTLVVLDALDGELDERLQTTARGLLDTLGQDIAELARRFGIQSVTAVTLNRAAAMRIQKGGVAAGSFSSQSPGERLRLRIATVIALLRVGARLGIATHPGLLMIDSLRAEEVQDVDAHALLDALVDIARDTPGLQVLTTSADATLPTGRLPDEAVLRPVQGDDALW